jgi:hypothetical protein
MALVTAITLEAAGGVTQNIRGTVTASAQSESLEHPTGSQAPFTHTLPINFPEIAPGLQSWSVAQGRMHAPETHVARTSPKEVAHSPSDEHPVSEHKLVFGSHV